MNQKMDFDDILIEWGYRVHNGQPNPKNTNHLYHLSQILYENGWPYNVVEGLMHNLLEQDSEREKLMKKVIKYKDKEGSDKEITVGGALKQGEEHPAYKQAKQMTQKDEKPKGDKVDEPSDFDRDTKQNKGVDPNYDRDGETKKPQDTTNPLEQEVFTEPLGEPTDEDFNQKNEKHSVNKKINLEEKLNELGIDINKVPKKYLKVLERMLNTNFQTDSQGKVIKPISELSHFISEGGAGEIRSQAGEILTMIGSSMQNPEREEFFKAIEEHIIEQTTPPNAPTQEELDSVNSVEKLKELQEKYPSVKLDTTSNRKSAKEGKLKKQNFYKNNNVLVQSSWLDAARKNNKAIDDFLQTEMGDDYEIVASSWDVDEEAKALGLPLDKKGKSTDSYIKVKDKDGNEKIIQISLKKDGQIRLTNSSPSKTFGTRELTDEEKQKFKENAADIGIEDVDGDGEISIDDIDESKWTQRQNQKYLDFFNKDDKKQKLIELIKSGKLKTNLKKLGLDPNSDDFESKLEALLSGKGKARDRNKLLLEALKLVDGGDEVIKEIQEATEKTLNNIVRAMEVDPIKEKMLNNIQESLPLRDIVEGREVMMVGDISMDKRTMKKLFGTDNFDEVKQNLKVDLSKKPPVVKYVAGEGEKEIIIATIGVREDGKNYGSSLKFEMNLSKDFENQAAEAHREVHN